MIEKQAILDREWAEVEVEEKATGFDVGFLRAGTKNTRGGKKTLMYKGGKKKTKNSDRHHPDIQKSKKIKNYENELGIDKESEWTTRDYYSKRKLAQRNKKRRKQKKKHIDRYQLDSRKSKKNQNYQEELDTDIEPEWITRDYYITQEGDEIRRNRTTTTTTNNGRKTIFKREGDQTQSEYFSNQWPNRPSNLSKWSTAVYLETDPLPYNVQGITIRLFPTLCCSRVALCVSTPARAIGEPIHTTVRELKHGGVYDGCYWCDMGSYSVDIFRITQDPYPYPYPNTSGPEDEWENMLSATVVRPGSVLRIVLIDVNAPERYHPTRTSWCKHAAIEIEWETNSKRYHATTTRELLIDRVAKEEDLTVDNEEMDYKKRLEKCLLLFVFHNAPKGVFANIMQFAFR